MQLMLSVHGWKLPWKMKWEFLCLRKMDKYSGQFKLRVPKALHKLLSQHAKQEGISMNQYCVYLLTRNDALNAK